MEKLHLTEPWLILAVVIIIIVIQLVVIVRTLRTLRISFVNFLLFDAIIGTNYFRLVTLLWEVN